MDPTFIQWLTSQVGIAGLAGFALYMLDKAHKQVQSLTETYANTNREDKLLLIKALDDHVKTSTSFLIKLDTLIQIASRREDRQ